MMMVACLPHSLEAFKLMPGICVPSVVCASPRSSLLLLRWCTQATLAISRPTRMQRYGVPNRGASLCAWHVSLIIRCTVGRSMNKTNERTKERTKAAAAADQLYSIPFETIRRLGQSKRGPTDRSTQNALQTAEEEDDPFE